MPISKLVSVAGGMQSSEWPGLYYLLVYILWSIWRENDAVSIGKRNGHWVAALVGVISISCYNKQPQIPVA